jgi:hypothetical protein
VKEYGIELDEQWDLIRKVLDIYPEQFNPDFCTEALFKKISSIVTTRCFGWSLPCVMVVPFADCLNHSNCNATNEMFDRVLHFNTQDDHEYHTIKRYETNH